MKNDLDNLTIILVLYKSTDKVLECINNLEDLKIIIVDNGGNKKIIEKIVKKNPLCKIIYPKKNLGFGKANNLAFQAVSTNYTLLLNPDTNISKKDIFNMISCIDDNKNCAVVVPKIYDASNFIGGYGIFPEKGKGIRRNYFDQQICNSLEDKFPSGDICIDTAWASIMLLKNDIIKKTGLFDEKFFMYWEDIEFCKRLREKRYSIIMSSSSSAVHYKHLSVKKDIFTNFIINHHSELSPLIYFDVKKNSFFLYKRLSAYLFRSLTYLLILNISKSFKNLAKFSGILIFIFTRARGNDSSYSA